MSKTEETYPTATVNTEQFRNYLSALNTLVDEARIHLSEDGFKSEAVDPANVAMVRADLDRSGFGALPESKHTLGANIVRIQDVLPEAYSDVSLTFEPKRQKLGLEAGPYGYTYSTIDPENIRQEPNIPSMDLSFRAEMNVDVLRDALDWFDKFSTHVNVGYDTVDGRFWMEGIQRDHRGNIGTDDAGFSLDRADLEAVHEDGEADSKYSLDYFRDILNGIPEGTTVELYIGEEFPMILSYEFEHGEVEYMQAPRIQSD